eukprot:1325549-Pyramimonas_sp.AAC.1
MWDGAPAVASTVLYDMPISNSNDVTPPLIADNPAPRFQLSRLSPFMVTRQGLESTITFVSPAEIGGLKSDQYLALNPQSSPVVSLYLHVPLLRPVLRPLDSTRLGSTLPIFVHTDRTLSKKELFPKKHRLLTSVQNPKTLAQGKMPLLCLPEGQAMPESEVIVQYLLDKYAAEGPSLMPDTPGKCIPCETTDSHGTHSRPCPLKAEPNSCSPLLMDEPPGTYQGTILSKIYEHEFLQT